MQGHSDSSQIPKSLTIQLKAEEQEQLTKVSQILKRSKTNTIRFLIDSEYKKLSKPN